MLTGGDLDTKRSLGRALEQISFPSQTQTSRQIACAKCDRRNKKKGRNKHNTFTTADFREFSLIFSHYYHEKGGKKEEKAGPKKVSRACFAKLQWSLLPIRSVSLAGVKLSEVCTARIMRKKADKDTERQRDKDTKWHWINGIPAQTETEMTPLTYSEGRRGYPKD